MNLRALRRLVRADGGLPEGDGAFLFQPRARPKGRALLLHGFTASPWEMRDLGRFLQRKGWLAFGARLAGHGQGRQAFERSRRADWLASAETAFQALQGAGRLVLFGHSMGGALAALLVAARPEAVAGVVLGAPAFRFVDPAAPLSLLPPARLFRPVIKVETRHPDAAHHWILEYASHRVAELVRLAWRARRAALKLRRPLLLLQARRDPVVSCGYNQRLFSRIPAAPKRLWVYDAAEHNVFHRHNPRQAEVFGRVEEFLREL